MTLEELKGYLVDQVSFANKELDEWVVEFKEDPASALEWSNTTFTYAARVKVYCLTTKALEESPFKLVKDRVRERVIDSARYPHASTSQPANLMALCRGQAYAEVLEYLECVEDQSELEKNE
jgi:hypothetical protein